MSVRNAGSIGEMVDNARNQLEIDARNQSYAVATEIVKNVITRYGDHDSPKVVIYWTALADGIFLKMKNDMNEIVNRK